MANLLNTNAPYASELSMILQLIALAVLVIGFIIVKQKKYKPHGAAMLIAAVLNIITVALVMIPVALRIGNISIPGVDLLFKVHTVLGVTVIGLSSWILVDWRFQNPGPTCFQRKKWMLGLSLFWIAQLIVGMLLFLRLYS